MKRSWIQRRSGFKRLSFDEAKNSLGLRARKAPLRGRTRLNAVGKKGRDWIAVRRQLSAEFAAQGITSCELRLDGCWGANATGWAHGRKRRHLKGDELKTLTALLCNPCHQIIEVLPAAEMLAIIDTIIEKRERLAA